MNKRLIAAAALVAAIAVVILVRTPREERADTPSSAKTPTIVDSAATTDESATAQARPSVATDPGKEGAANTPDQEESKEPFRVDATGKLILDEVARLNLEAFFARTAPQEIGTAALELVGRLPPAAATQALDIVERYRNYQAAQDQNYVDEAPASPEDAIVQLESLHTLRVEHFGAELAKAFYGDAERLSRELIELMRLEKDQSLTMEEKAERAQRLHDTLPAVSAADKGQRPPRE